MTQAGTGTLSELEPFWMPFSPNKEFKKEPRLVVRAEGMYLYTPDGRALIDASAGLFCVAAGHCRPEIAEAVFRQLKTLDYAGSFQRGHPKAFELAGRIAEYTPTPLNRVFFVNSGSEAVDTAMKMALMFHRVQGQPQRQIFISRERAYHGVNFGGVALAGMVNNRRAFGTGLPVVYHMRHTALPENRMVKGQPERGAELADDLQRFCQLYGAENIAAVFVEPTAGSYGCLPPPRGYLNRLREICDQNGILLVFDEVICGWGRMGANFGAQAFGVTPDLLTMAKALTNGAQPMGAVAARQSIYDAITDAGPERGIEFFHGYTYSAHPVACAAGLAMIDIFAKERLVDRARAMSPYFIDAVHSLSDLSCVADIRSYGMLGAVELHPQGAAGSRGHEAQKRLFDSGVHLKSTGESLILAPPLVVERSHIDEIVGKLRAVLAEI
ncbi:MAG TPA: aminotransferase class III-fold pyridoxal phosphate-dependent enzyme [Burkholderiaceae bacterium]|jgi:beta-alanine--pyruvate transaminase|nr:aminotransferase class III-fold pyridoxal phosphate-dependent enzyme [Burkholderiaceae bacterium]